MYKIEKGIPGPSKYPFKDMEIGDSFLVPIIADTDMGMLRNSIMGTCRKTRYPDKKFMSRLLPEGIRCWRVE